jgi:cytochrome P450
MIFLTIDLKPLFSPCIRRFYASLPRGHGAYTGGASSSGKIAIGGGINEPRDALLTILYGLLTNPDQLGAVRAGGKWRSAFEEGVRWVAPIQASSRLVMEDTEIRGCLIPKGDTVMTIQASANRDEDVFEDGENYNGLREPNPHQTFGNGSQHCAGAHLSRRTVGAILLQCCSGASPT